MSIHRKTPSSSGVRSKSTDSSNRLHAFVDRSIIEVYVDGGACTARMFPDGKSLGVDLFAEGGEVRVRSVDVWEMRTMWEP